MRARERGDCGVFGFAVGTGGLVSKPLRDRLGRDAPTPDSASLCPVLQRSENAPLVEQRRAILAPGATDRKHHVTATARRIASPLPASLSFRYTQGPRGSALSPTR